MSHPRGDNTQAAVGPRATYFRWEEFDGLPRLLRDLMNYTPVNVGTGYVFAQVRLGRDVQVIAREAHARWSRYARKSALHHYGPTHPQAAEGHSDQ